MKILRAIYTLCAATLLLGSCQDEEMIKQSSVQEGIPVTIDLTFSAAIPEQEEVGTRAVTDPEYRVNDLYVLIFNANTGKLKGDVLFYDNSALTTNGNNQVESGGTLKGTLSGIKTTTGKSVIYAIANAKNPPSEYTTKSGESTLEDRINDVQSISDLEAITAELSDPNSSNALFRITDTHYLMSGSLSCIIGTDGIEGDSKDIPLYRTDSKITFNIKAGMSSESKCESFTLLSYQVCKVASKTSLVPLEDKNYDTGKEDSKDYWNTEAGIQPEATNTITFYVPENIKKIKDGSNATKYADREKWESEGKEGASVSERTFINAPDNGTYVVLHGLFEGTANTTQVWKDNGTQTEGVLPVRATVDYIIHLGDWTNDQIGTFSNCRNTEYIYTITVNGVDDIVVEVETKEEKEPGAEGDVFFQDGKFFNVDGHNVALLMEFTSEEINNPGLAEQNYFVARINSPFGAGQISVDGEANDATVDDDWLLFSLNEKGNDGNYLRDKLRSYPGDPGKKSLLTYQDGKLMSLQELLTMLKNIKDKTGTTYEDKKGDLVVTCYVKEYTYDDYDSYLGSGISAPIRSNNWGAYTNQSNREAYIFGDIRDSEDKNSSTIHTKYVISQRSIQTMDEYEGYGDKGGIGLGIETYNETGEIPMGTPSVRPEYTSTGHDNMIAMLGSRSGDNGSSPGTNIENVAMWGYIYNEDDELQYQIPDKYKYAAYACLLRNRDENGDGSIEGDEIKWYLPALDQYTAFYVGMDALSNDSKLYSPNVTEYTRENLRHYFTGTWSGDDPYIIWAEEGLSTQIFGSETNDRYPDDKRVGNYLTGQVRDYRCIRNLGTDDKDRTPFYSLNGNIITINHQKAGVFRSRVVNSSLDEHDQEDIANRVYRKFQVAKEYIDRDGDDDPLEEDMGEKTMENKDDSPDNSDKDDWYSGDEVEGYDPCRTYTEDGNGSDKGTWRLPNQRELLIMMTARIFKENDFAYVIDKDDKNKSDSEIADMYEIPWDKVSLVKGEEKGKSEMPRKKHVYKVFSSTTFKFKNTIVPWGNSSQKKWRYYMQANGNDDDGVTGFIMQLQALDLSNDGSPNFLDSDKYPSYGFIRCVRDVE